MFQDRCPCANAGKIGVWAIPGYDLRSLDWGGPMNYTYPLNFEWDEAKPRRALPSADLILLTRRERFLIPTESCKPTPGTAMVGRYQLTGMIDQRLFVVVYTPRHDAMRVISARKANQRVGKHYEDSTRDD